MVGRQDPEDLPLPAGAETGQPRPPALRHRRRGRARRRDPHRAHGRVGRRPGHHHLRRRSQARRPAHRRRRGHRRRPAPRGPRRGPGDAPGRQDRHPQPLRHLLAERPPPRLHPGRRRGQPQDQGRPVARPPLHLHPPPRRHRHGRHGRSRPGRHRAQGGHAGHGGQGQPARDPDRAFGHAHPPRHQGLGRDRRDRRPHRSDLRRHPARGHLGPPLLRDRGAHPGPGRHPGHARRPARHGRRRHGHPPQRGQGDRHGPHEMYHRHHRPGRGRAGPGQHADVPVRPPRLRRRHRPGRPGRG